MITPRRSKVFGVGSILAATIATACSQANSTGGGQAGTSAAPPGLEAPAERAVPVAEVVDLPFERTLALPGELTAFQDVEIHARVPGFIRSVEVDRGSVVQRGAVLAHIDAPELQAQASEADARVQTAEAQLLEARAALLSEQSTFDRLRRASATPGVVAGNDVDVAEQKTEAARARADAAGRQIEAMRQAARSVREIDAYRDVTAPFDGVVTERTGHPGSLVGPGAGPIVRMQQVSPLRLVAAIPEEFVGGINTGQSIEFSVSAFPGETFAGRVARAARTLDPKTRTMPVELDVDNRRGRLAPGMYAEVRWPLRRTGSSLFVPRSAVAATTERTFVVRVQGGVVEWVDVKRGAAMGDLVEVVGSLQPGDQVAARATDELRPGTRVRGVLPLAN